MAGSRRGANDPQRRERILTATLDVIAEHGVHRVSHRKIAEQAQVPLGSLTYYFSGLEDILSAAFEHLVSQTEVVHHRDLVAVGSRDEACSVLADFAVSPTESGRQRFVLLMEMYSYSIFSPEVAGTLRGWLGQLHRDLCTHFSPAASRAIAALIEGWVMHRHFAGAAQNELTREAAFAAVRALAELEGP